MLALCIAIVVGLQKGGPYIGEGRLGWDGSNCVCVLKLVDGLLVVVGA